MKKLFFCISIGILSIDSAYSLDQIQINEILAAHNQSRIEVNVPNIKWSSTLAKSAQVYANTLAKRRSCGLVHSGTRDVGENLYWASPITQTVTSSNGETHSSFEPQNIAASEVVEAWADEKQYYDYTTNTCVIGKVCGHYTQLIWKTTTHLGCAKATCGDSAQVWVCHYAPPGNYIGQKPY
jgi:pathogenesis-related protein 1